MFRRSTRLAGMPMSFVFANGHLEKVRPALWDSFDHQEAPEASLVREHNARKELAQVEPLDVRESNVDVPTKATAPNPYDPNDQFIESDPHAWEKVIQEGVAAPSDEFGRKMFLLDAIKPDINTNLYVQIIVDALEEACAEDIVVLDVTQKNMFAPDAYEWVWMDVIPQRAVDVVVWASGKSIRHLETITESIRDKAKKGLIPCETDRIGREINPVKEEIFWGIKIPCGKIMIDLGHPNRREYRMVERKHICQPTEHAGRMMEDFILDQGWVRVWDFWTPNAPCVPRADYEGVYTSERCHGWERLDILKPEYVITDQDLKRRTGHTEPEAFTADDLAEPLTPEVHQKVRKMLEDREVGLSEPSAVPVGANPPSLGTPSGNVQFKESTIRQVTDEDIRVYAERLRKRLSSENIHVESPETKVRKDKEWEEYERRREARIRKYGYYDYVELSNDYHRGRLILPDRIESWNPSAEVPSVYVTPHPENYLGKPRDTHWGPGWYDI